MCIFFIFYFLVDKWLLHKTTNLDIASITWSDHAPASITHSVASALHKIWRANPFILQTSPYTDLLQKHLIYFFQHNIGSVSESAVIRSTNKAFTRAELIQIGSQAKMRKVQCIDIILTYIDTLMLRTKLTLVSLLNAHFQLCNKNLEFSY